MSSSKVKIELNRDAVKEQLLKSSAIMGYCEQIAQSIRNQCGDGYEVDTHTGPNRINAMVYADSYKAVKDNSKHNTLLKAVGAIGGLNND